jgi:hydroxymethylpyrimidine kinase/phosphomethylpyrimidine kinase
MTPLCILTIAGSDSGGGAGIQADQRTIRAVGGHALTAVTAVTAQDTRRISAWRPVADSLIAAQVESALRGFEVCAVKTGLLPGSGAVRAVCKALELVPAIPLVVDPVLSSSSGTRFLSLAGVRILRDRLLPMASLVTPNWPEAAALAGIAVGTHAQARRAALLL